MTKPEDPPPAMARLPLGSDEVQLPSRIPRRAAVRPAPARGAEPPTGQSVGQQVTLVFNVVWQAIERWWKIALPLGILLGTAAAAREWYNFEPKYYSTATLWVQSSEPYLAFRGSNKSRTRIHMMKTSKVIQAALEQLGKKGIDEVATHPDPVSWIQNSLVVLSKRGTDFYTVGFRHQDATTAQAVVEAVVNAYLDFSETLDDRYTKGLIAELERQKERKETHIANLRADLRQRYKAQTGRDPFATSATQSVPEYSPVAELMSQLGTVEVEILETGIKLQELSGEVAPDLDEILLPSILAERIESHPGVMDLETEIATRSDYLDDMEAKMIDASSNPYYRRLTRDLQQREQSLAELRGRLTESLRAEAVDEYKRQYELAVGQLKTNLTELEARKALLDVKYEEAVANRQQATGESLELSFDRAALEREEEVHRLISRRVFTMRTELNAPSRQELWEEANLPKSAEASMPTKKLGMFLLGGLIAPFGLAVVWEQIQSRIGDASQLVNSNVHVVGEVAVMPGSTTFLGRRVDRQNALFEESVHSLCTRLRLSRELRQIQVLGISSAVSDEGKTILATQLAMALEKSLKRRILLIDADMRSPDVCRIFEIPTEPGLAQVLSRESDYESVIVTSFSDTLHLMPAGRLAASPHSLLGSELFTEMIDELRERYDFIIIDAPPLLSSSEALVLATAADANLLCARRNFSRTAQIREAYQRLFEADANPIGVVLNGVPHSAYAAHYGQYPAAEEPMYT